MSCSGRHVLIVEDIVDTGGTLKQLMARVRDCGAASVKVVALLNKEARRKVEVHVDYEGFKCPDEFVVGCAPLDSTQCSALFFAMLVSTGDRKAFSCEPPARMFWCVTQVWHGL
jgi:hypoxanthine phosphoribosyltransferase